MLRRRAVRVFALAVLPLAAACQRPPAPSPQEPLTGAYRAERMLQAAVDVGLSFQQLAERLQLLAGEIAVAKDGAESGEQKAAVQAYEETVGIYKDALAIWRSQLESAQFKDRIGENNILANEAMKPMVEKYKLQTVTVPNLPAGWQVLAPDSVQRTFKIAGEKGNAAAALYRGLKKAP